MIVRKGSDAGLLVPSRGAFLGATNLRPNAVSEGDYTVDAPVYLSRPVYQTVSTLAGFSSSVSRPSGTVAGDFLLGFFAGSDEATDVTPPSGWSPIAPTAYVNSGGQIIPARMAYKFAGGSEPTSYSYTAPNWHAAAILRITGVDPVTPIADGDALGKANGVSTAYVPSLVADRANSLLVMVGFGFEGTGPSSTPAGMTTRVSWSAGEDAAATQPVEAGAVGGQSYSTSGTNVVLTLAAVINPAA